MELFNSTINDYDEFEDDNILMKKIITWLQTQVSLQFCSLQLVAFVLPPFACRCHSFKFSSFEFILFYLM